MMAIIKKVRHEGSDKFYDDDGIYRDDGFLKGYESDNVDFGPMQSFDDKHLFSVMSHVFVIKCLRIV